jgi:hypothetical protein
MPLKIGDLVTVRDNKIDVQQFFNSPFHGIVEPIKLTVRKGTIFEIVEIYKENKCARIQPVNHKVSLEFVIISELDNLLKCGRAVEYLYGEKKK